MTARPSGVVLKYALPPERMWNAPHVSAAEALLDERGAAVDQAGELGAVRLGAARHRGDVGLVVLADVGGVGAGDGTLVAHPRDRDRGVEAAREGDADAFAGGQGGEDLRHRKIMHHLA